MQFDEYQKAALRTATSGKPWELEIAVLALGVAGEGGEVADYLKKVIGHDHPLDVEVVKKELGDVLWYVATLSARLGLNLNDVAAANVAKLRARYPDGFSAEASQNREIEP